MKLLLSALALCVPLVQAGEQLTDQACFNRYPNTDLTYLDDLKSVDSQDHYGCVPPCLADPQCYGYSYMDQYKKCWLKSKTAAQKMKPTQGVISGLRKADCIEQSQDASVEVCARPDDVSSLEQLDLALDAAKSRWSTLSLSFPHTGPDTRYTFELALDGSGDCGTARRVFVSGGSLVGTVALASGQAAMGSGGSAAAGDVSDWLVRGACDSDSLPVGSVDDAFRLLLAAVNSPQGLASVASQLCVVFSPNEGYVTRAYITPVDGASPPLVTGFSVSNLSVRPADFDQVYNAPPEPQVDAQATEEAVEPAMPDPVMPPPIVDPLPVAPADPNNFFARPGAAAAAAVPQPTAAELPVQQLPADASVAGEQQPEQVVTGAAADSAPAVFYAPAPQVAPGGGSGSVFGGRLRGSQQSGVASGVGGGLGGGLAGGLSMFSNVMGLVSGLGQNTCPNTDQPVCGTDGQTYPNKCRLTFAQTSNPFLRQAHVGPCETVTQPVAPIGGYQTVPSEVEPSLQTQGDAMATQAPTFSTTTTTTMTTTVPVPRTTMAPVTTTKSKGFGIFADLPNDLNRNTCDTRDRVCANATGKAICGSDGVTYANGCMFAVAWCDDSTQQLRVKKIGSC